MVPGEEQRGATWGSQEEGVEADEDLLPLQLGVGEEVPSQRQEEEGREGLCGDEQHWQRGDQGVQEDREGRVVALQE